MMILPLNQFQKHLRLKYEFHQEAYKILEKYYGKKKFNDGRKKMAKMPRGAKLIYNPSSAAPGFMTKNVLSLPGVPSILNSMIENCKRYLIKGLKIHSKTLIFIQLKVILLKSWDKFKKNTKNLLILVVILFLDLEKLE